MSSSSNSENGDLFGQLGFQKKDIFKEIIEKYSVPVKSDVIDLKTLTIVEDHGYVRRMKKCPFAFPKSFFTEPIPQHVPEVKEAEAKGSSRRKPSQPQKSLTPTMYESTKRKFSDDDDSELSRKKRKNSKGRKKRQPKELEESRLYEQFKKQIGEIPKEKKVCKQQVPNPVKRKMEEELIGEKKNRASKRNRVDDNQISCSSTPKASIHQVNGVVLHNLVVAEPAFISPPTMENVSTLESSSEDEEQVNKGVSDDRPLNNEMKIPQTQRCKRAKKLAICRCLRKRDTKGRFVKSINAGPTKKGQNMMERELCRLTASSFLGIGFDPEILVNQLAKTRNGTKIRE